MAIPNKILLVLLLCGCSTETTVNRMADNIRDDLTSIAEDVYMLPPECGEQSRLAQRIELTRERIDIMEEEYINETDALKEEKRRLELMLFMASAILFALAILWGKRLLTRVFQLP